MKTKIFNVISKLNRTILVGRTVVKNNRSSGERIINAAALQDHLVRNLNLSLAPPKRRARKQNPSQVRIFEQGEKATLIGIILPQRSSGTAQGYRKVWICESCTLENDDLKLRCTVCHTRKHRSSKAKLSLAQTRGLVSVYFYCIVVLIHSGTQTSTKIERHRMAIL